MLYTISETPLQTRKNNIFLSALFSLVLAVVITAGHFQYPETYNDMFFGPLLSWWSLAMLSITTVISVTTRAQRDVLHQFSNINAPVSASATREANDIRTASAANQKS